MRWVARDELPTMITTVSPGVRVADGRAAAISSSAMTP